MADASLLPLGRLQLGPLGLTDLPNEILCQIIRELFFTRHRDGKYLASLCLVCQRFRDIVEPQLYHTLTLEVDTESHLNFRALNEFEDNSSPMIGQPELRRTLSERPTLGSLVRVFTLGTDYLRRVYDPHFVEHHLPILALLNKVEELHLEFPHMFSELPFMPALK